MPDDVSRSMFVARKLTSAEASARVARLAEIFSAAVLDAGPRHYSVAQVQAWAATANDLERWQERVRDGSTWVAMPIDDADRIAGLVVVMPNDHVDMLYVDPAFHRRGIATALLATIEPEARAAGVDALTSDVSLVAHPVFARAGYEVVEWQDVERRGQVFRRARMRKVLR